MDNKLEARKPEKADCKSNKAKSKAKPSSKRNAEPKLGYQGPIERFSTFLVKVIDFFLGGEIYPIDPYSYLPEPLEPWEEYFEEAGFKPRTNREVYLNKTNPINVSSKAASKIFAYTNAVEAEIGGLLVIEEEGGVATVTDALLYKQRANVGGVLLDAGNLAKQLNKIALEQPEKLEKIKGWWHSHYNFSTFWSPTDDACFSNFLKVCPVTYGIVVNTAGKAKARVDMKTGIGLIRVCNADFELGEIVQMPECVAEAKQKVKIGLLSIWPLNYLEPFFKKPKVPIPIVAKQGR